MSGYIAYDTLGEPTYVSDLPKYLPAPPTFADGPVADTAQPVTAEAVVSGSDADGPNSDTVPHA